MSQHARDVPRAGETSPGRTADNPDVRRSTDSALWYVACTGVAVALPLVTLPVFTRVLEPAQYGAWVLAYAYGLFVSALSSFGLPLVYERSFFEVPDGAPRAALLWTTFAFAAATLALALAISWAWRDALSDALMASATWAPLLFWTACAVGVGNLKLYFLTRFRNGGEARSFAAFTLADSLLGACAAVAFVVVLRSPLGLAWGPLLASGTVLALLVGRFALREPVRIEGAVLKSSLALGVPLLPRVFVGLVGQVLDKWIVGIVASMEGLAAYAIGQRLGYVVFAASTALENVFQPRTYQLMFRTSPAGREIGTMLTPFAYATVGVALAVGLWASEIVALIAPGSYAGAAAVASVLVLHYAALFFGKQPQLLYAKKTGVVSMLSAVSVALNAGAMWLLAVRYGALGAAIGTTLAGIVTTALAVHVSQRYYRIGYERAKLAFIYGFLVLALALAQLIDAGGLSLELRVAFKLCVLAAYALAGLAAGWLSSLAVYARPARPSRAS